MKTNKRLTLLIILLGTAFVISQELFYEPFIVPRLSGWKEVPVLWWIGAFSAEILVCIIVALVSHSTKEWLLFCLYGGLFITTIQWVQGFFLQPGHLKATEGGIVHFGTQFIILSALLACFVGLVRLICFRFKCRLLSKGNLWQKK
ncbi:MAG: hypothetical protein ABIK92_00435 [Pseudomonadota bacterium]